jgi:DNA-binding transcriptional LysR family regulator
VQHHFGRALYRRVGRGIELTADGRVFFTEANEILRRAEELEKKFTKEQALFEPESVVIGGSRVLSRSILLDLLVAFKADHPNIQLEFKTESSFVIERLVANHQSRYWVDYQCYFCVRANY